MRISELLDHEARPGCKIRERGDGARSRAEELRQADKLLLVTDENPDGDALGSLLGTHEILRLLGKDSVMYMARR